MYAYDGDVVLLSPFYSLWQIRDDFQSKDVKEAYIQNK